MSDKKKILPLIGLQMAVLLYAFTGFFTKKAAGYPFLSLQFCLYYGGMIAVLGIYAVLWQQFLKRFPLNTCYASRAMASVWTMVIAYIAFHEKITVNMMIGAVVIIIGVFLAVTSDE